MSALSNRLEKTMSLYRFKSRETGDLVMLQQHGRRILEILGKSTDKGVIQSSEMAAAQVALREAAEAEVEEQNRLREEAKAKGEVAPEFDQVSLHTRNLPFVEMMQRCAQAKVDIVWGV
jgi:hypothetical protein